jgi:hypothetical protein
MDGKAANYGDRLKHALLFEVLERTVDWPRVMYAETHAGAGVYHAGAQTKGRYIADLRHKVEVFNTTTLRAGTGYLTWLKLWWSTQANWESYPGSAMTAHHWLQSNRPESSEVRLTEMDEVTCERLRHAISPPTAGIKNQSFLDELDWLTEKDNLILLVDPFGCVPLISDATSNRGVGDALIDHPMVMNILQRCLRKERAIISLWWGFGQAHRNNHSVTCDMLTDWTQQNDQAECRIFHDKHNHANALIGIGSGTDVIRSLPDRTVWKQTWLDDAIYERD